MRKGDIEIHVRGVRLRDLESERVAELIAASARMFGATNLVRIAPTYFVLRPRPAKEETPP